MVESIACNACQMATCCKVVGAANVANAVTTLCYKTSLKYHMRCMTNVWWGGGGCGCLRTQTNGVPHFHTSAILTWLCYDY